MAWRMVGEALKNGIIKQQPCIICGDKKSLAHHEDYDKPIEVDWLCFLHHQQLHRTKRITT